MDNNPSAPITIPVVFRWLDRRVAPLVEAGPQPLRAIALAALYLATACVVAWKAPSLVLVVLLVGFAALVPLLDWWAYPVFLAAWALSGGFTDEVYHPHARASLLAIFAICTVLGISVRKFRQAMLLGRLVEAQRDELQTVVVERTAAEHAAADALLRLSNQLDLARRVQQRMVAMPDTRLRLDGIQLALSGASIASMQVCGDFHRAIRLTPSTVCVVIGDVMGRGVASALVMAMSLALFEDAARMTHDPAQMLTLVNRRLCEGLGADFFVTAAVAVVDGAGHRYAISNAGHEPPVLLRGGSARVIGPRPGLPLGIAADETYGVATRGLKVGDRLVMFTDGLIGDDDRATTSIDRRNLRQRLLAVGPLDARAVLQRLVPPGGIDDDVTLVAVDVERAPPASTVHST